MARLIRESSSNGLAVRATAVSVRPDLRVLRQSRLSGAASYVAAENPVDTTVSSFARVIDVDFQERSLAPVVTEEVSPDGYDW